ncbi:MAG: type I 3-dehydroquinate dehydratase [Bacillus sp. (in: firmicutes)]
MNVLKIRNVAIGEGAPKVIIPLVGRTEEQLLQEAGYIRSLQPDAVEWRADLYEEVENLQAVEAMLARLREVFKEELLLFTFRSHKEGGDKVISDAFYVELNQMAIRTKWIDLVDVELFHGAENVKKLLAAAKENGVFVIMSNHDFAKTPPKEEIIERLCRMQAYGADILKIAVMPKSAADVITLLDATNTMSTMHADRPIITMSMGGQGVISRLSGELFGSAMTFGAGKEESAPGQVPVAELRSVLEVLHKQL